MPKGSAVCTGSLEISPELVPPREKRAKRETLEGDMEEGELIDSSEEEQESSSADESSNAGRSPAKDMAMSSEKVADGVDKVDCSNK